MIKMSTFNKINDVLIDAAKMARLADQLLTILIRCTIIPDIKKLWKIFNLPKEEHGNLPFLPLWVCYCNMSTVQFTAVFQSVVETDTKNIQMTMSYYNDHSSSRQTYHAN